MVAPQYLNPTATKNLMAPATQPVKRPPVYQYSRITRPETVSEASTAVVTASGITAAAYIARALEAIGDHLSHFYEVAKDKIRFRGQAVNYSAAEGATFSWVVWQTRSLGPGCRTVLVAVALFVGILLTEKQARDPVAPKSPTVAQAKTGTHDDSTPATSTVQNTSSNQTTAGSNTSSTTTPPVANTIPITGSQATTTTNTSTLPSSTPVVGGMAAALRAPVN